MKENRLHMLGSAWIKLRPNYFETIPSKTQSKKSLFLLILTSNKLNIAKNWMATNWLKNWPGGIAIDSSDYGTILQSGDLNCHKVMTH